VWFGKKFILLESQLALPDTISREEIPALLEVFAHASGALRLPQSSGDVTRGFCTVQFARDGCHDHNDG
jgi:hypothetical protein